MEATYTRSTGKCLTYVIRTTKRSGYTIELDGRLLRANHPPSSSFGAPRWGSKRLEAEAVERAKADIEALTGMSEE